MEVGFTGTREGMTDAQKATLRNWIAINRDHIRYFRHGDCIGSDEQAHEIALDNNLMIVLHPPDDEGLRAWCKNEWATRVPKPYLDRNKDIVRLSDYLIATPDSRFTRRRSGTWSTVRYAQKIGTTVAIIWPDGQMELYGNAV